MTDELDEWFLDELPGLSGGGQHVHEAVVGEHDAELEDQERLVDDVVSPEPRNSLVPDASQQLLHIGMSYKGFLLAFDGKF